MQTDPIKDAEKALAEARREMDAARKTYTAKQQRFYQLQNALYKARSVATRKVEATGHSTNPIVDMGLNQLRKSVAGVAALGGNIQISPNGSSVLVSRSGQSSTKTIAISGKELFPLPFLNSTARSGQTLFAKSVQGSKGRGLLIGEAQTSNGKTIFTRLILKTENHPEMNLLKP
jgi:hypothetical protein